MYGQPEQKQSVKRLGDLLVESGYVSPSEMSRAVEIARKNFQSLGKVLVSSKICKDQEINAALEMQKLCKLENMSGSIAVRALMIMRTQLFTSAEALHKVGWSNDSYRSYQEPEPVVKAKQALKELDSTATAVAKATAIEKVGDAYLESKLAGRAEVKYEEAMAVLEDDLPASARALSHICSKLSRLAVQQKRHDEAKAILDKAQSCLEDHGHRQSKEYVRLLHVSAEYHVSKRKYSDAEDHLIDSFNTLEPQYGLNDDHVLETVWIYVETINKSTRDPDKVTLGELLKGAGAVTEEQLTEAWQQSKQAKMALGRALVTQGIINERTLQHALQTQLLVRNGEITAQLGIWIVRYAFQLDKDMDSVLEMLHCQPKSRGLLSGELKSASNEMANMEARLPSNHPDLAFAHAKVANIYFQRQQWVESDHHYKRALTIFSSSPTAYTEKALDVIDHYCDLKIALDDLDEAVRISQIAVRMRSKHYGEVSIPFAKGLEKLAVVFCAKMDHASAVGCLDQALAVREKLYGLEDRELIACLEAKGDSLAHSMDYADAEAALDRALEIALEAYGNAHEITERVKAKLVDVCKAAGNIGKVRELAPGSLKNHLFF